MSTFTALVTSSPSVADGPLSTCRYYQSVVNIDAYYPDINSASSACAADFSQGTNPGCGYASGVYVVPYGTQVFNVIGSTIWYYGGQCWNYWLYRYPPAPCPPGTEFAGPSPGSCRAIEEKCPVAELTELKDLNAQLSNNDPDTMTLENNPINTARLTTETQAALACLRREVETHRVPFNLTSAFRTEAYQRHLWEIYDRWKTKGLSTNADPGCQARKAKVKAEWDHHGLEGLLTSPAVDAGKHPKGIALDVSRKTTMKQLVNAGANIQELAKECNLSRPLPILDKGHFESK